MNEIIPRKFEGGRQALGLLDIIHLNYSAWINERSTKAELRGLECRRQLAEARKESHLAEHDARGTVATAASRANEAEADYRFHEEVRAANPIEVGRIIGADAETQRLLLERDRLRRERVTLHTPQVSGASWPKIEPALSDKDINTLALRAVRRAAQVEPRTVDGFWQEWREQARHRLPAYAADEAIRRADELWEQTR